MVDTARGHHVAKDNRSRQAVLDQERSAFERHEVERALAGIVHHDPTEGRVVDGAVGLAGDHDDVVEMALVVEVDDHPRGTFVERLALELRPVVGTAERAPVAVLADLLSRQRVVAREHAVRRARPERARHTLLGKRGRRGRRRRRGHDGRRAGGNRHGSHSLAATGVDEDEKDDRETRELVVQEDLQVLGDENVRRLKGGGDRA